jgi:chromosome partitioning protein
MAHLITIGSDQKESGKTTLAMHLALSLILQGHRVCTIDIDPQQRSLTHYLENRKRYMVQKEITLPLTTTHTVISKGTLSSTSTQETQCRDFGIFLKEIALNYNFIIIDTQSEDSFLSLFAHSVAQTLITPYHLKNDAFESYAHSLASLIKRTEDNVTHIKWFVVHNRSAPTALIKKINKLASSIGYSTIDGLKERPLYKDLFLRGLVLLDLFEEHDYVPPHMSHIAARLELKNMLSSLHTSLMSHSTI